MDIAQRNRIVPVLFAGVFMAALDTAIIAPAIPALRAALGIDNRQVALVTIVYVLGALCSAAPMARLSDRYGRRLIYLLDVGLFAAGSLLVAVAPNFGVVLLGRALQGIGAGGITPTASAVIGDTFPAAERGRVLGLLGATFGMAFLLGPLLASVILLFLDWRWLFLLNLPVAALVMMRGSRVLPATRAETSGAPLDLAGLAVSFVLLTSLTLSINHVLDTWLGRTVWPFFLTLAVISVPLLIFVERRAAQPVIPVSLLAPAQLGLTYLLTVGAGFGMGSIAFLSSLAVAAFALPAQQAGFLLIPLVLASSLGSVVSGRLLNTRGARPMLLGGFGLVAFGALGLWLWPTQFWLFLAATVFVGMGVGVVVGGVLRAIVLQEAPPGERGVAQGLINICTNVGNLLVLATMGAIADAGGNTIAGFSQAYGAVAAVMLVMLLLAGTVRVQLEAAAPQTAIEPRAATSEAS